MLASLGHRRAGSEFSDTGRAFYLKTQRQQFDDDEIQGELTTMKELQLPPPHNPRREEAKRSRGEHDVEHEENTPTDAPDVENRHLIDKIMRVPTVHHPKGRQDQRPR